MNSFMLCGENFDCVPQIIADSPHIKTQLEEIKAEQQKRTEQQKEVKHNGCEVAKPLDLVAREGIKLSETSAVKLAATGLKNVAALLLALARSNYKVKGQAEQTDSSATAFPPKCCKSKPRIFQKFRKLAKEFGVL